jgi:hypothetical protein
MDGGWHFPAPDTPRREDSTGWLDDNYFVRRAGSLSPKPGVPPVLSFDRPMRDYVAACQRAGLELRDIDEPELSEEGRAVSPPHVIRRNERVAMNYVLKCVRVR